MLRWIVPQILDQYNTLFQLFTRIIFIQISANMNGVQVTPV